MSLPVRFSGILLAALTLFAVGCASSDGTTTADESELRETSATLRLSADFTSSLTGAARAG